MQASDLRGLAAATSQLANELEQAGFSNAASDLRSAAMELEQAADKQEQEND